MARGASQNRRNERSKTAEILTPPRLKLLTEDPPRGISDCDRWERADITQRDI